MMKGITLGLALAGMTMAIASAEVTPAATTTMKPAVEKKVDKNAEKKPTAQTASAKRHHTARAVENAAKPAANAPKAETPKAPTLDQHTK